MTNRIKWVDCVRGIAILLVVIGHVLTRMGNSSIERLLHIVIYSFHMPLFFFLSGFVFKTQNINGNVILNKVRKLIVPMIFYCFVYAIFYYIKILLGKASIDISISLVMNTIFMTNRSFFGVYWFFPVLFVTQLIFSVIYKNGGGMSVDNDIICNIQSLVLLRH